MHRVTGDARRTTAIWAGVYDGLSARLADRAGFDGCWLSSYGVSVSRLGLPDAGHVTGEELADVVRVVGRCTQLPIAVDAESGRFADVDDPVGFAARLLDLGAHSVCWEDSAGPKFCSLWSIPNRSLVAEDEMVARYRAIARRIGSGRVIGRTEALVAGLGIEQAVRRVRGYADAGCGRVVVHFRDRPEDALEVAARCADATELVIIPTAAPGLTLRDASAAGFSVYVAAHAGVRAAAQALTDAFGAVQAEQRAEPRAVRLADLRTIDAVVGYQEPSALHVERRTGGDGAPIVLVSAALGGRHMWDKQMDALSSDRDVVRFDMRGTGESPTVDALRAEADDIEDAVALLGLERPMLMGLSSGARAAAEFAVRSPDVVNALVLVSPALPLPAPTRALLQHRAEVGRALRSGNFKAAAEADVSMWLVGPDRTKSAMDAAMRAELSGVVASAYESQAGRKPQRRPAERPDLVERLRGVACATLIVVGEHDDSRIHESAAALHDAIEGAQLVLVPDAGHLVPFERPEAFNEIVGEFLRRVDRLVPSPRPILVGD